MTEKEAKPFDTAQGKSELAKKEEQILEFWAKNKISTSKLNPGERWRENKKSAAGLEKSLKPH